ncbi:tellurite resistance TerB family protein [Mangrovivirga cuniculi]|uniref:Co-chaperone DjlA N-terminal domain-containing protein n=1 Tax=Mangrovivirga cuniculi TaxID=2715131 RepID=A0A4D7K874_9BACT|nr:TerB family tellurite resistance protein [Mangrovivirga cuniculi]QCK15508.1 hypothetical protein DCC35_12515 [Mangrovivirga cuniculi]
MDILFFKNIRKKVIEKQNKKHLINLCALAIADGTFDESEKKYIMAIGKKMEISENDIANIIKYSRENAVVIKTRRNLFSRKKLSEYYALVLSDGVIHPNEARLINHIGLKWGFNESQTAKIIGKCKKYIGPGNIKANISKRLEFLLTDFYEIFDKISSTINKQVHIFAV